MEQMRPRIRAKAIALGTRCHRAALPNCGRNVACVSWRLMVLPGRVLLARVLLVTFASVSLRRVLPDDPKAWYFREVRKFHQGTKRTFESSEAGNMRSRSRNTHISCLNVLCTIAIGARTGEIRAFWALPRPAPPSAPMVRLRTCQNTVFLEYVCKIRPYRQANRHIS